MRFLLIFILAAAVAYASGPYSYAFTSTPFTPPEGFLWTPQLFIELFALANMFLLRWLWRHGWVISFCLALLMAFAVFAFTTLIAVNYNYPNVTHAAWGSRVFWGWGGGDCDVSAMLIGNLPTLCALFGSTLLLTSWRNDGATDGRIIGWVGFILLFGVAIFPVFGIIAAAILAMVIGVRQAIVRFGWKSLAIIGVNIVVLAASMTPFALSGAYQHGVIETMPCRNHFGDIGFALSEYALQHEGRLPAARTIDEMFTALVPYNGQFDTREERTASLQLHHIPVPYPPTMCYAAQIYDRHPRPYTWNSAAFGKSIDELRALKSPLVLMSCPYHEPLEFTSQEVVEGYDKLMERMREWEKRKEKTEAP